MSVVKMQYLLSLESFGQLCSMRMCMEYISSSIRALRLALLSNTHHDPRSSSLDSQTWRLICSYNWKFSVQKPNVFLVSHLQCLLLFGLVLHQKFQGTHFLFQWVEPTCRP